MNANLEDVMATLEIVEVGSIAPSQEEAKPVENLDEVQMAGTVQDTEFSDEPAGN